MVGIKIVELLRQRGIACTLSDLAEHIFPTAAFDSVAEEIERRLVGQGVEMAFGKGLAGLADRPEGGVTVRPAWQTGRRAVAPSVSATAAA